MTEHRCETKYETVMKPRCAPEETTKCIPDTEDQCQQVPSTQCSDKISYRPEQKCSTNLEKVCQQITKTVVEKVNVVKPIQKCRNVAVATLTCRMNKSIYKNTGLTPRLD